MLRRLASHVPMLRTAVYSSALPAKCSMLRLVARAPPRCLSQSTPLASEEPSLQAATKSTGHFSAQAFHPGDRPAGDTSRKYVRVSQDGRAYATGRRKTATARVWVWPAKVSGEAAVTINGLTLAQYFGGHWAHRYTVLSPFFKTDTAGLYNASAEVQGGGLTGKAEAIRLGIATAMQGFDIRLRSTLKEVGYLTRDRRKKERKKPGQAGARKKFAWVKR